jgi:hypothetical protein
LPAEHEKVPSTERAPAGLEKPMESSFNQVPHADSPKIDRSATRTLCAEQDLTGDNHDQEPAFGEARRSARRPCWAAATCSGFLELLVEVLDQFLSLAACRL